MRASTKMSDSIGTGGGVEQDSQQAAETTSLGKIWCTTDCCCCLVARLCPAVCDSMDCSPARLLCPWDFPGRVLEWVAIAFSTSGP